MIFIIKVTTNKEERALHLISDRVEKKQLSVYSVVKPHGLRGYIMLEALDRDSAEEAAFNLPYVKGIVGKTVSYEEIKNMLQPEAEDYNIEVGDIVEIPSRGQIRKRIRLNTRSHTVPPSTNSGSLLE